MNKENMATSTEELDSRYKEKYKVSNDEFVKREADWSIVEELVLTYQKQFKEEATYEECVQARKAAGEIVEKFSPLVKKYMTLLRTGQIDWNNMETKSFISNFVDSRESIRALNRKKQTAKFRDTIHMKFEFIVKTYGQIPEDEMLTDLQSLLLLKAQKYQQMGKNFCSYLYNSYKFEVSRHIKKFIKNPLNIPYKNLQYEDFMNGENDNVTAFHEDNYYEETTGIPGLEWVNGISCSEIFSCLSNNDRKILVKYYLEDWNDQQIATALGMHINTVNQRRRSATKKLAEELGIDISNIKRTRRSGKKAVLPC